MKCKHEYVRTTDYCGTCGHKHRYCKECGIDIDLKEAKPIIN